MAALALTTLSLTGCALESATTTPTAAPTVAPTTIPLPGGGKVDAGDELVIYTAKSDDTSGATPTAAPVRVVRVYDLTQSKQVASFGFGTKDDPPIRAVLAGDQVVTATSRRVISQQLDGTAPRSIYIAPANGEVLDIDASADGKLLATIARSETTNPATAIVRVNYLVSGGRALTLAVGDPRFGEFQGTFASVHWQSGGHDTPSFVIGGSTDEPGHTASSAIVSVDGAVTIAQPSGPAWLAPAGDTWAVVDQLVCTGARIAGHHLAVHEINSDRVLWQTDNATPLYTPVEWSPDGQTLIYATRPDDQTSCDAAVQVPTQFYSANLESGEVTAVADLGALQQQWYGQALVTASCQTGVPVTDRWQHLAPLCPSNSSTAATLSVGGSDAGKATDPVPVAIINGPASGKASPTPAPSPTTRPSAVAQALYIP